MDAPSLNHREIATAWRHNLLKKKIVYKPVMPEWVAWHVKNLHVGEYVSMLNKSSIITSLSSSLLLHSLQ
jgi:hypothetical protein